MNKSKRSQKVKHKTHLSTLKEPVFFYRRTRQTKVLFVIRRLQHATPGIFVSNIIVKENCGDSDAALDLEGKIHWESMVRNITS